MAADRDDEDDELSWWDALRTRPRDEDEETLPPPPIDDALGAEALVRALFRQPPFGEAAPADVPTLRAAAAEKLRSAGLFGSTAPSTAAPPSDDRASIGDNGEQRPTSWKLPVRNPAPTILGDDTALGAGRLPAEMGPGRAPNPGAATPPPRPSSAPPRAADTAAASPLDRPAASAGLALTAADTLLRKGVDLAVALAGGNPALARRLIEMGANALAGALPAEYRASAAKSAEAAAAEAERRIGDNERIIRTRAAIATLANRRAAAEHEHAQALVDGDPARLAATRRDLIDAWRAERRARGDGEAEINAGARALEAGYRRTALRHRLAQLDETGIERALAEDDDAKDDPAAARAAAEDIRRTRRDDPARAGEASIERVIAAKKRDGRIDTTEEETAARYRLRLDTQARRGIPENERRLLANDERAALALEYRRIEASQGKDAADQWLDDRAQQAGSHAQRLKAEINAARSTSDADRAPSPPPRLYAELAEPANGAPPPPDPNEDRIEPAQDQRRLTPADTASREARAERVLERYKTYLRENRNDLQDMRDGVMERLAIEEGELPAVAAQEFAARLRRLRGENEMGSFIKDARRIVRLADALPHSVGPDRIPKETLRVARKIVERADGDPVEAERNPRTVILDGIRTASEEAFGENEIIDPLIPFAVGMAIEPLRRRGIAKTRNRTLTPEQRGKAREQLGVNSKAGDRAETQARQMIVRDIEAMGIAPQAKRLVRVEGQKGTIPDLPVGTKHDQIDVFVEVKKLGARHREPQRRRLRAIRAHYVEIDPDTGASRALVPPYKNWISYEEWLRVLESELARKSRP